MKFCGYETGDFFDEMFGENGQPRAAARPLARNIESLPDGELVNRQQAADQALIQMGITFNVYGESAGMEKTLPFDLVPRIVQAAEWDRIERGLKQRIRALNLFIDDLYHERKIIRDGVVPEEILGLRAPWQQLGVEQQPGRVELIEDTSVRGDRAQPEQQFVGQLRVEERPPGAGMDRTATG